MVLSDPKHQEIFPFFAQATGFKVRAPPDRPMYINPSLTLRKPRPSAAPSNEVVPPGKSTLQFYIYITNGDSRSVAWYFYFEKKLTFASASSKSQVPSKNLGGKWEANKIFQRDPSVGPFKGLIDESKLKVPGTPSYSAPSPSGSESGELPETRVIDATYIYLDASSAPRRSKRLQESKTSKSS